MGFQQNSIARRVSYTVGPAGTGQPSVRYPKLDVQPSAFFALGSPIGMFMAVRGVESLGEGFKLPACPTFLNIFHPYDPVAYRIESLVDKKFSSLRPVVIPHHMGRKRMHLELKDTMTRVGGDIKAKVMESLKATMGAVYSVAGTLTGQDGGGVVDQQYQQEERTPRPWRPPASTRARGLTMCCKKLPWRASTSMSSPWPPTSATGRVRTPCCSS